MIISEYLPHKTLDPIPCYSAADLFAYRNPKPGIGQVIGLPYHQDAPGSELQCGVFEAEELTSFPKP
jgi:hypothetical protein